MPPEFVLEPVSSFGRSLRLSQKQIERNEPNKRFHMTASLARIGNPNGRARRY